MILNWRKWGFGFSFEFGDPLVLRLWIGPLRLGWKYGHVESDRPWRQWLLAGEEGSVQRRRFNAAVAAYAQGASHDEVGRILDGARDPEADREQGAYDEAEQHGVE